MSTSRVDPTTNEGVTSNRLHKRRQRARNQAQKQTLVNDLLARVPSLSSLPLHLPTNCSTIEGIFQPIPRLENPQAFWSHIPVSCNPRRAVLSNEIADSSKLQKDKVQQAKFERKLNAMVVGDLITTEEQQRRWEQHGRITTQQDKHAVSLLSANRGQRKAFQVENFVVLLREKLSSHESAQKSTLTVVDFGSGSGNLTLALAAYFSSVQFVLVDKKSYPLKLAQRRADAANLSNVQTMEYNFTPSTVKEFSIPMVDAGNEGTFTCRFDIGIGLHSCGSFTDMVMELCLERGADCIVCPCCNGAMTSETTSTCGYLYPRSQKLRKCLNQDEYLGRLSRSADDRGNYAAKCLIELDRALWAQERGSFHVGLWKLSPPECTPKHHLLYLEYLSQT